MLTIPDIQHNLIQIGHQLADISKALLHCQESLAVLADTKPAANGNDLEELLTCREAAEWLGITPQYLSVLNRQGTGPNRVHVGQAPRYRRSELLAWVEKNGTNEP